MAVTEFSQDQLDEIYIFAVDLGRKAGEMLLASIERRIGDGDNQFEEKDSSVDIVTQTDEGSTPISGIPTHKLIITTGRCGIFHQDCDSE